MAFHCRIVFTSPRPAVPSKPMAIPIGLTWNRAGFAARERDIKFIVSTDAHSTPVWAISISASSRVRCASVDRFVMTQRNQFPDHLFGELN